MDAAPAVGLRQGGLAEPDRAAILGLFGKHPPAPAPDGGTHVPIDAGGAGRGYAGVGEVKVGTNGSFSHFKLTHKVVDFIPTRLA